MDATVNQVTTTARVSLLQQDLAKAPGEPIVINAGLDYRGPAAVLRLDAAVKGPQGALTNGGVTFQVPETPDGAAMTIPGFQIPAPAVEGTFDVTTELRDLTVGREAILDTHELPASVVVVQGSSGAPPGDIDPIERPPIIPVEDAPPPVFGISDCVVRSTDSAALPRTVIGGDWTGQAWLYRLDDGTEAAEGDLRLCPPQEPQGRVPRFSVGEFLFFAPNPLGGQGPVVAIHEDSSGPVTGSFFQYTLDDPFCGVPGCRFQETVLTNVGTAGGLYRIGQVLSYPHGPWIWGAVTQIRRSNLGYEYMLAGSNLGWIQEAFVKDKEEFGPAFEPGDCVVVSGEIDRITQVLWAWQVGWQYLLRDRPIWIGGEGFQSCE